MKGVLLAGGAATRLRPISQAVNKHLLPVYDRPMIHYPLRTLTGAGIRDILLVTGSEHIESFVRLLGTGERWGCRIQYAAQERPTGTGAAILLAEEFTGDEDFVAMLGDNLFTETISPYLWGFPSETRFQAKILVGRVRDAHHYGVIVFRNGKIADVLEKPAHPPSSCVNTGAWMVRRDVYQRLKRLPVSPRGEYEMTQVLASYAHEGLLGYARLKRKWLDMGSFESLYEATRLVRRARRQQTVEISVRQRSQSPRLSEIERMGCALEA